MWSLTWLLYINTYIPVHWFQEKNTVIRPGILNYPAERSNRPVSPELIPGGIWIGPARQWLCTGNYYTFTPSWDNLSLPDVGMECSPASRSSRECAGSRLFGVHVFVYVCVSVCVYIQCLDPFKSVRVRGCLVCMYLCMCVCVRIYIPCLDPSKSVRVRGCLVCIYLCMCVCVRIHTVSWTFKECAGSRLFCVHACVYVCMCAYTYSVLIL